MVVSCESDSLARAAPVGRRFRNDTRFGCGRRLRLARRGTSLTLNESLLDLNRFLKKPHGRGRIEAQLSLGRLSPFAGEGKAVYKALELLLK